MTKGNRKKTCRPSDVFSAEKTRGDSYWIMDAAAPNGNHYWQVEIVHIISNAPSWHPNISSK